RYPPLGLGPYFMTPAHTHRCTGCGSTWAHQLPDSCPPLIHKLEHSCPTCGRAQYLVHSFIDGGARASFFPWMIVGIAAVALLA
ncbi:MAG: hypothetical protein ACRD4G_13625, partial [Bryobacteraceae bacterium]